MVIRVSSPTFVGRLPELQDAGTALDRAPDGRPTVILIAGEAGVGKTRFVQEIGGRARRLGFRVLAGGCVELGGAGLPYGPIVEALRGLVDEFSPPQLGELLGTGRADLARLLPSLRQTSDRQPVIADSYGQMRLFEHLLLLLRRLGAMQPVALVAEDIQWADRSTLELLGFLVHNLRHGPIVLLATYRSDELHRRHPLLPFLASVERGGRAARLELARFDRREVSDLLEGILGAEPDPDLVDAIYARSGGNAFFAEELLAAGIPHARLPDTLAEVLVERVSTLSEPAQELVRVASAAGPRIRLPTLAAVIEMDEPGFSAALREAATRQILVPTGGGGDDWFVFRHALVQEAIYGDLMPGERSRLHAAFARALESSPEAAAGGTVAAELAYHWQAAQDLPRALDAWIRAGLAAEGIYASAEAQAHFERALELWARVPDAEARAPLDRAALLNHAAAAAEARAPSRSVACISTALGLVDETVDAVRAGLLYERLGQYAQSAKDHANALAAYREAVRLIPPEPPSAARALALAGLGQLLCYMHRWLESASACEEALRVAGAVGDGAVESKALAFRGIVLAITGDVAQGLEFVHRAREIAEAAGDASAVALARSVLAACDLECARNADAVAVGLEAEAHAVRHGLAARYGVGILRHAAFGLIALGRWDEAAAVLERAQQYYPSHQKDDIDSCLLLLDSLRGQSGSAARRAARTQLPSADTIDQLAFAGLAEWALWQEDPHTARAVVQTTVGILDGDQPARVSQLGWACSLGLRAEADLAELARARGATSDLEDARAFAGALLGRMRALAQEVAVRRPFFAPQATAFLTSCEAEWSRAEGASDPDLWAMAATAWDDLAMPYPMAYALMREGQASLVSQRDRARASAVLRTAHAIAIQLRAEPLGQSIEAFAARAGMRRMPSPGRRDRVSDLSARELEVLVLVAEGRSDGEIAELLFISKKTASVHVAHIKSKLGAGSRVEVATRAVRLGLLPGRGT